MVRTRQAAERTVLVLGVVVVLATLAGCGATDEPQVLGTSVTAPTSSTTSAPTSTTTTTADVDVRISATSVVRGDQDDTTTAPPANARRSSSATTPTLPAGSSSSANAAAVAEVRSAIGSGDLCAAYRSLARFEVSGADAAHFRRDLLVVVDLLEAARPLVPTELTSAWAALQAGTRRVVAVLDHDGATVDEAAAVYRDERFRAAMEETDEWVAENCEG